ncbi:zinc finger domain-containing protein [Purpureocillium lavendulum]|uniref:Zinc finger domain-containing protein n=1 Tax=Purpureocillium lavendulum TaxID=1247861 RepID=A0AB34G1C2_9HYPO|nr:zinc finger domain-containing protein [Purpureocillium lavendulum]
MFPLRPTDDANVRPLTDEDHQQLLRLVQRYGIPSLLCALTGSPNSSGASTFSASTLISSISAPSLAWTNSDASQCRSDDASIHTQCTWPELAQDMPSLHEPEPAKIMERSWLDSPGPVPSPLPPTDVTSHPSPQLLSPTSKKYQCPMCFLDSSPVGFGRKSDFKKHLHNFHGSDVVWICRTKGCHLSFSTERAYSTHAKDAHRMKALPNSTARTELCTQVVFACGFASCKDRIFEAQTADDSSATRDRHFEHIAKHFEDRCDVRQWEYRVQIQNLMRQPQVKQTWKTGIWPKEKRQQLSWRPRSSGDLKRMLECRHLGNDISTLVRLAYILGTAPFTAAATPPPSEIDSYFQLPVRSLCLIDTPGHCLTTSTPSPKMEEDDSSSTLTFPKRRSSRSSLTQSVFRLPSRQGKRSSRPPTPASVMGGMTSAPSTTPPVQGFNGVGMGGGGGGGDDTIMADDPTTGPHPGTPFPIPNEAVWPVDAPKFAPEAAHAHVLPKQLNTPPPVDNPHLMYAMQMEQDPHQSWCMPYDPYAAPVGMPHGLYDYTMNASEVSTVRPATPVPSQHSQHKRPASWGRVVSMESMRPVKKSVPHDSPSCPPEMMPTMLGM